MDKIIGSFIIRIINWYAKKYPSRDVLVRTWEADSKCFLYDIHVGVNKSGVIVIDAY